MHPRLTDTHPMHGQQASWTVPNVHETDSRLENSHCDKPLVVLRTNNVSNDMNLAPLCPFHRNHYRLCKISLSAHHRSQGRTVHALFVAIGMLTLYS
jgi:hypothetical protein